MSIQNFVAKNKPLIVDQLDKLVKNKLRTDIGSLQAQALRDLQHFSTKGKMLRGNFVMLGNMMYRGTDEISAAQVAAALELNQSGLLIHDDIMDNDDMRRGEKSIFAQYEDIGKDRNAISHTEYGMSMGILIGDIAFFLSYELLSNLDIDEKVKADIMRLYSEEMFTVSKGQMNDYDFGQTSHDPSENEILEMYLNKTGRYTFVLPFVLGAILGGAKKTELKTLEKFGESLGVMFQIKDDEIGLFQDEKKSGKPAGSDVRENKKTLVRHYLYESVNERDKAFLDTCFGNKDLSEEDLKKLRDIALESDARERIELKVRELSDKAKNDVDSLSIDSNFKESLHELIIYSSKRSS